MPDYADPEHYFAVTLSLACVRNEDYERLSRAIERLRDEFCCGGSSVSIEGVKPKTVLNRLPQGASS